MHDTLSVAVWPLPSRLMPSALDACSTQLTRYSCLVEAGCLWCGVQAQGMLVHAWVLGACQLSCIV
jgi:hypothetical protein